MAKRKAATKAKKRRAQPRAPRRKVAWNARTQGEIAKFFGVALNTVLGWGKAGMPGRKGSWPLDRIAQWLRDEGPWKSKPDPSHELSAVKSRLAILQIQAEEIQYKKQLGQVCDVDEVAGFIRRCVANAKATFEPLPDLIRMELPTGFGELRERIYELATRLLRDACSQLAVMAEKDEAEEPIGEDRERVGNREVASGNR